MNRSAIPRSRPAARQAGFTLIELMIAMILGLVVIAGITSVFLAGQQSFRANHALSDVQDSSRIAFELMARDIRQAGMTGCGDDRVANVLNNGPNGTGTQDWWANWANAVHGYEAGATDPAATTGTAETNRASTTDSLQLVSAGSLPVSIKEDKEPAANFKLNESSSDLQSGDIIMVCSPDHATIVQITNYNDSNVTVVHNTGTASPGNCSKGLGYPTDCGSTNGNSWSFPENSTIAEITGVDWYIGYNPVGGKSLYRYSLVNTGGAVGTTPQEMVRDVTDMQITYLVGGGASTSFVDASAVTDWSKITAVHVELTVESTFKRAGVDTKPISRQFAFTTTLRNRVQ